MSRPRHEIRSPYLEWAKTRAHARFNLATSGLANYMLAQLPVRLEDLELSGADFYGYEPLQKRLAARYAVRVENVVAATGTSMANHLAMAAVLDPGDEVLIEQPAYEPLLAVAEYLGARIRRFPRRREDSFLVDPAAVAQAVTHETRLIVLTNLHNPSSALIEEYVLREVGEIASRVGASVLVDEVYLEAVFRPGLRSAFHIGENFIVTSSLTKIYGLSGLRCGWVLAPPPLTERMWRLNDLFGVIAAHPAERLSVVALYHIDGIAGRARALLETNRALVKRFLDSRRDLQTVWPEAGTCVFPRLLRGDADAFCALLRQNYETSVVPGRFFEMPEHFRLGMGGETENLAAGLERLGAALDQFARS